MKTLTNKYEQLQEDRSDVVAHLKRELEGKIEEARELGERLQALEEVRKKEQAENKKKESAMELEYRTMESNLSAEVKLAGNVYLCTHTHTHTNVGKEVCKALVILYKPGS